MKRILAVLALLLALSVPAFASGTWNTPTASHIFVLQQRQIIVVTVGFTSDGSGNPPLAGTLSSASLGFQGYMLAGMECKPGTVAPSNSWTVTLTTAAGTSLLASTNSNTASVITGYSSAYPVTGDLGISIGATSVHNAVGSCSIAFTATMLGSAASITANVNSTITPAITAVLGVEGQGVGVQQVTDVNSLSALVATATLTSVVAAPASNSTIITGMLVEKSTGSAGTVTIQYGTTVKTACDTGTTVLLGPITNPQIGYTPLGGIVVPSGKIVCAQTDASTTGVRLLYK